MPRLLPLLHVPPALGLPVGKILCLGRNYGAHVKAMAAAPGGGSPQAPAGPDRASPVLFSKPSSALVRPGGALWLPPGCERLEPEAELVLVVGRAGHDLAPEAAADYLYGYAAGLDMTDRTAQETAKQKGHPWDVAKGFDGSAALTPVVPAARVPDWRDLRMVLDRAGTRMQEGRAGDMLLGVGEILALASRRFALAPGDLVFTGAPAGTPPVDDGDRLELGLLGRDGETLARGTFEISRDRTRVLGEGGRGD